MGFLYQILSKLREMEFFQVKWEDYIPTYIVMI